jgi:hypothetical protein
LLLLLLFRLLLFLRVLLLELFPFLRLALVFDPTAPFASSQFEVEKKEPILLIPSF